MASVVRGRESPGELATAVDALQARTFGSYVLGAPLGDGGMGIIFAAEHPATGRRVAIKVMRSDAGAGVDRFEREIGALAALRHPSIVEYIDHGISDEGQPFLVMERLAGEDLQQRLRRSPLTVPECIELGIQVAEGLAAAHTLGIVHRDIKPSNLFLSDARIDQVKLLDFGVARLGHDTRGLTRTGAMIGTLGFMAPEQARGEPDLDGRADLFSLGCVLHECLTGTPVFSGEHPMAVLAKILLDQAPRLRLSQPEVPVALDELIAALLAKHAADRPGSAAEVAARLAAASRMPAAPGTRPTTGSGVTLRERRVFSLLLVRVLGARVDPLGATSVEDPVGAVLRPLAASFGASYSPVLGGGGLVSVELDAPASDVAMLSARCALAIKRRFPEAAQVLATGRGERSGRSIVGGVIDQVSSLEARASPGMILLDRTTAELLADRFTVEHRGEDVSLGPERETPTGRMLLGKAAPFVGRAREVAWLAGVYRQAVEESQSRAALVTGAPGAGKSRLFREFARTLSAETPGPLILLGRGSPMTSGAALGMLRSAVRLEAQIGDDDDLLVQRGKLRRRLAERVAPGDLDRVTAFLGELGGIHHDDEQDPALPLAHRDARVMADCVRLALLDWLRAECRHRPVLLVLEDLHWGDEATVAILDAAIQVLNDLPLVVLGLARPEVHSTFVGLWASHHRLDLELPPISTRASETMVRQVLGEGIDEQRVRAVAARADGNPLFLEELIRIAAEGAADELPETILSVVQTRVCGVDDESRRLLRAASVFGGSFSEAGLRALLGDTNTDVSACLSLLVEHELLSREPSSGGRGFRFRHALVRDAAYAMLTDDDMRLAHELAAGWLSGQPGVEPMAVAEHLIQAKCPARALVWFRRAAEQALEGGDLRAAVNRAEQALTCGAEGAMRAELRLLQAEATIWTGSLGDAERWAIEAAHGSQEGGATWFAAIQRVIYCLGVRCAVETALAWLDRAEQVEALPEVPWGPVFCLSEALYAAHVAGDSQRARGILERLEARVAGRTPPPAVMGQVYRARANELIVVGRFDSAAAAARQAAYYLELAGDLRGASRVRILEGHCLGQVGAYERAEEVLRAGQAVAERLGVEQTLIYARGTLGDMVLRRGRPREARELLSDVLERSSGRDDPRAEGATRVTLGLVELMEGRLEAAETLVRAGYALLAGQRLLETWALAMVARVSLACGRRDEAARLAALAAARMEKQPGSVDHGWVVWWTIIECLEGQVPPEQVDAAMDSALTHLRALASLLDDVELRKTLLLTPENRALVARANARGRPVADLVSSLSTDVAG